MSRPQIQEEAVVMLADELESRDAHRCAALVREARAAYLRRGLVT